MAEKKDIASSASTMAAESSDSAIGRERNGDPIGSCSWTRLAGECLRHPAPMYRRWHQQRQYRTIPCTGIARPVRRLEALYSFVDEFVGPGRRCRRYFRNAIPLRIGRDGCCALAPALRDKLLRLYNDDVQGNGSIHSCGDAPCN